MLTQETSKAPTSANSAGLVALGLAHSPRRSKLAERDGKFAAQPGGLPALPRAMGDAAPSNAALAPGKKASRARILRPPPTARPDWSLADMEIASLLAATSTGDDLSFARLYAATRSRLLHLISRIERDAQEAEEILQEVYLSIWRRGDQFDGDRGSALQWLAGIARNRAIERLRARERRPKAARLSDSCEDAYLGLTSECRGPLEEAIRSDEARAVWRGLRLLGAPQREIVLLSFWQGLSHEEIAQRTGRPLGTVKSWVRRSLIAMRESLANPSPPSSLVS